MIFTYMYLVAGEKPNWKKKNTSALTPTAYNINTGCKLIKHCFSQLTRWYKPAMFKLWMWNLWGKTKSEKVLVCPMPDSSNNRVCHWNIICPIWCKKQTLMELKKRRKTSEFISCVDKNCHNWSSMTNGEFSWLHALLRLAIGR